VNASSRAKPNGCTDGRSKPMVDKSFDRVDQQFKQLGLLPSKPLMKALTCVRERRAGVDIVKGRPRSGHRDEPYRARPAACHLSLAACRVSTRTRTSSTCSDG